MKNFAAIILFVFSFGSLSAQVDYHSSEVTFTSADGVKISATYLYPKGEHLAPAIILIHQGGSSREEWFELPLVDKLLEQRYAVLAYDVRQHGKSGKDEGTLVDLFNNPERAPLDLLAAIEFLGQDNRIDSNRIGVLGASIGANLACVAASSEKFNIKSVVSMSAKTRAAQNLSGSKVTMSPRNAYYIASRDEQEGQRAVWAEELYEKTTGKRKIEIAPGDQHGSFILRANEPLQDSIVQWFKDTL